MIVEDRGEAMSDEACTFICWMHDGSDWHLGGESGWQFGGLDDGWVNWLIGSKSSWKSGRLNGSWIPGIGWL